MAGIFGDTRGSLPPTGGPPPSAAGPGPGGMPPPSTAGRMPPKLAAGFQKFSDAVRANPHVQRLQQQFSSTPRGQKIAAMFGGAAPGGPRPMPAPRDRDAYAANKPARFDGAPPAQPAAFKKGGMVERNYGK